MNRKFLAWMFAGCCGLLGVGYLAATRVDPAGPAQDTAPSEALNPPALPGKRAIQEQDVSWHGEQLVRQALDSTDAQQQDERLRKSLTDWTTRSPRDAAQFVQGLPAGISRDKALRILAQTWGGRDSDAALSWAGALSDRSEHDTFLTNLCLGLAQRDPEAAVEMACVNHDQESGLVENLTQQWAEKETPAALAWATQQAPGPGRDQLLQRIALVESRTDPAQAASLVEQQMQPGPAQMEAALTVVHQWGERDWNGAAAWVKQFPEGYLRDRATTELNGIVRR